MYLKQDTFASHRPYLSIVYRRSTRLHDIYLIAEFWSYLVPSPSCKQRPALPGWMAKLICFATEADIS